MFEKIRKIFRYWNCFNNERPSVRRFRNGHRNHVHQRNV